jgi:CheY-like chemotaxis protein
MPGMDGLALLRAAKRLSPATPVVIVTAYASESVAHEATSAGAAACLVKPFTGGELLETVRRALAARA